MNDRVILHSDLNGFYASVECFLHPEIKHLPVAVCGDAEARHGIILAKNEIAKKFGIKTGQAIWQAKQLCPRLVTLTANFSTYIEFSKLAKKIYLRYTDKVESFGIDECWLDVSALAASIKDGKDIADEIRQAINTELGITASVGVSWNKIYAKLGSDIKKPNATTVISKDNYKQTVFTLPADNLLMVGKATKEKLNKYNIFTIGQIAAADITFLKQRFGKCGESLWLYASGRDTSPVANYDDDVLEKSVSNSTTTIRDLTTINDVKMIVTILSESVAGRLRDSKLKGDVVHLGVRTNKLTHWGKQTGLCRPTFNSADIINAAMSLFALYDFNTPIRSLSIRVSGIQTADCCLQTDMFLTEKQHDKKERLEFTIDEIRNKFGHFAIRRAVEHLDRKLTALNPKGENINHPDSY